jgi:hypothetical protein
MDAKKTLLDRILAQYRERVERRTFTGIKLQEIDQGIDGGSLRAALIELTRERTIDIISSQTQLNPHIKRLPPRSIEMQLEKLDIGERYHTCIYPTPTLIAAEFDLKALNDLPFLKQLALGQPQLEPAFFEVGVIDRYRQDPRYSFKFSEYTGTVSMKSESEKTGSIPERDQVSIQTFGLGMDNSHNPVVCVFLRYLAQLSAEHQRHWQTYLAQSSALMHENYYKPTILGQVWENNSGISALRFGIASVNRICSEIWNAPLFINDVPEHVHYNLSPFMRPTKSDYLSFAHELDKILSENINTKFFEGKVARYSVEHHADGTLERKPKGTITLLDEWLFANVTDEADLDELRREIIEPLRKVRRERQPIAHSIIQNEFDVKYTDRRRTLLRDAAFAVGNIFFILRSFPKAPEIRMPKWFEEGRIEVI